MPEELIWEPSPSSNPSGNCPRYANLPDGGKALCDDGDLSAVVRYDAGAWAALKEDIISGLVR